MDVEICGRSGSLLALRQKACCKGYFEFFSRPYANIFH